LKKEEGQEVWLGHRLVAEKMTQAADEKAFVVTFHEQYVSPIQYASSAHGMKCSQRYDEQIDCRNTTGLVYEIAD